MIPGVNLDTAKKAWFTYKGCAYSVKGAPSAIFVSAVLAMSPTLAINATYCSTLREPVLDLFARWWLLCALHDSKKAMALYGSRRDAEKSCSSTDIAS